MVVENLIARRRKTMENYPDNNSDPLNLENGFDRKLNPLELMIIAIILLVIGWLVIPDLLRPAANT